MNDWAEYNDYRIINKGNTPTFSSDIGESIVDLTLASPDIMNLIKNWRVATYTETLSDHRAIIMQLNTKIHTTQKTKNPFINWNVKKFNQERFAASIEWSCSTRENAEIISATQEGKTITEIITRAMDFATPRSRSIPGRKQAYWWNETIDKSRKTAIRLRRVLTKARKADQPIAKEKAEREYKIARNKLKQEITSAKSKAWRELILLVNDDPWGKPYRVVMKKLKNKTSLVEQITDKQLRDTLITLFPRRTDFAHELNLLEDEWDDGNSIGYRELIEALKNNSNGKAPGLDGIPGLALKKAPELMLRRHVTTPVLKKENFLTSGKGLG